MSNEAFRAAMRERAARPFALVKSSLQLGGVYVYVRKLSFKQTVKLQQDNPDDDLWTSNSRRYLHSMFSEDGQLLLDPLNDDDLRYISEAPEDFWQAIAAAISESDGTGKALAQTPSS